jgi:hypothetical protein
MGHQYSTEHRGVWSQKSYCPADLEVKERHPDCGKPLISGGMMCDLCPLLAEYHNVEFRGCQIARKRKGTKTPEFTYELPFSKRKIENRLGPVKG